MNIQELTTQQIKLHIEAMQPLFKSNKMPLEQQAEYLKLKRELYTRSQASVSLDNQLNMFRGI